MNPLLASKPTKPARPNGAAGTQAPAQPASPDPAAGSAGNGAPTSAGALARDGTQAPPAGPGMRSRACSHCGAPLADGQDWCLYCGTNAERESSRKGRASWYSAALLILASALLASGAAAAGYAALNQSSHAKPHPAVVAAPPSAPTPSTPATPVIPKIGNPITLKPPHKTSGKAAKHAGGAAVKPSTSTSAGGTAQPASGSGSGSGSSGEGGSSAAPKPAAIELDTNAASTYDPYGYPKSQFGDPSLAIDGDESTAWTGQVAPASAAHPDFGLLINVSAARRLGSLEVLTSTPGFTLEIYGANAGKAPETITDHGWTLLARSRSLERKATLKLLHSSSSFRFLVLWVNRVPASLAGSTAKPGHVALNEIALFAPLG